METSEKNENKKIILPVMPLRGLVLFPKMFVNLDVGRKKSIDALNDAMKKDQTVFFTTQKNIKSNEPSKNDLHSIGIVAKVHQVLRRPGNAVRILVEGSYRAKLIDFIQEKPFITAEIIKIKDEHKEVTLKEKALIRQTKNTFAEYIKKSPKMPSDLILEVESATTPGQLADSIAANISLEYQTKQMILSETDHKSRLKTLLYVLLDELEILNFEDEISTKLKEKLDNNQKEYYLREQMKLILEELGESDNPKEDAQALKDKILKLNLSDEVNKALLNECERLFKMPPGSHEADVIRGYLETCISLPWNKKTKENINLKKAEKILERDHFGLKKVKERIIEVLATRKLSPQIKGQIICFAGPPGVGKTSIAKSIAEATGRKYARVSLGGVKDESEIRGHRRTYIGSMPGRIISAIKQSGYKNSLILLDEVDKLSNDFKGDPTSALLEVLDAEQNSTFHDHYIDLPFDLSDVLFITTANDLTAIPQPLLDRMDVITLTSYTHEEKFQIAKRHLIKKQMQKHGIDSKMLKIKDDAINEIISFYTKEAGVRNLERTIASLLRKCAKRFVENSDEKIIITKNNLEEILGPQKFKKDKINSKNEVGLAKGLAWTSVGGETLPIEVALMKGSGKLELTGSLGDVMKESAKIAISCIRSQHENLQIKPEFYSEYDIHIHVPEGAIPKDGPSAGVTMATAIVSALKKVPVKKEVAMTGEITLRGRVLPVGGLKEKTMAAYRAGIKTVIVPYDNEPDLEEVDDVVKKGIKFILADCLDVVLKNALVQKNKVRLNKNVKPDIIPETVSENNQKSQYISQ